MARFVFSMESILQIKLKLEDQAKAEYAVQMAQLQREQEKLEALQKHKEEVQAQLRRQISAVLDLLRIRQLEDGVENIKYNISLQKMVVFYQQKQVTKAREKLKENAFEDFKKELNAEEQKEINELVSESVFVIVSVKVNCVTLEIINKLIYDFDSTFSISFVSSHKSSLSWVVYFVESRSWSHSI